MNKLYENIILMGNLSSAKSVCLHLSSADIGVPAGKGFFNLYNKLPFPATKTPEVEKQKSLLLVKKCKDTIFL